MNGSSPVTDEMLMAYADGELTAAERARIDEHLSVDAAARQRAAIFAATGRGLAKLFEAPMLEPVPQPLVDAVMGTARPAPALKRESARQPAEVVSFESARERARQRQDAAGKPKLSWAAAASIALLFAAAGAQWYATRAPSAAGSDFGLVASSDGGLIAGSELASVLNSAPSGTAVAGSIGAQTISVEPVFSFAASGGEYCRQYVIGSSAAAFTGVACRDAGGAWQNKAQVASGGKARDPSGGLAPAGKDSPEQINALVDRMIVGDVLGADGETAAMKSGWATSPAPVGQPQ